MFSSLLYHFIYLLFVKVKLQKKKSLREWRQISCDSHSTNGTQYLSLTLEFLSGLLSHHMRSTMAPCFYILLSWRYWSLNAELHTCWAHLHFCSGYFEHMVSLFVLAGMDCNLSILSFPLLLGWPHVLPFPGCFSLRWGFHFVFPSLALKCCLDLSLSRS
jgi:hypothetical protein